MNESTRRLLALLRDTAPAKDFSPRQWSEIIAAARSTNLLGTLAERINAAGIRVECGADRHLAGARQLSARQRDSIQWEAQAIDETLADLGSPVVLLKGAAYVMGAHANRLGRLFGDIDILVSQESIGQTELRLMMHGWVAGKLDAYDQRYYREWMHELPPLVHMRRGTVLDVHHTILPPTSGRKPKGAAIIERARPLEGFSALRIPAVEDLVIHSLTHLVHEGELNNGLRDLCDIDSLIRAHGMQEGFWERLQAYSREHELCGPVALGLRLAERAFETPLPDGLLDQLKDTVKPQGRSERLLRTFELAMSYWPDGDAPLAARLATTLLYVRAHSLRMPPRLLARHLARKWMMRFKGPTPATEPA